MGRWTRMLLILLTIFFALSMRAHATTYYIAANGSDSNSGTVNTSPWLHAPGMANCTSSCAAVTIHPGDSIIFRGGDTWGSASFVWNWTASGGSGNRIYIGVDKSWYSGASWTRPIMDCQSNCSKQLALGAVTHVQVDDLEWRGLFDNSASPTYGEIYSIDAQALGNSPDVIISNNYFHAWDIAHDGTQDAILIIWSTGSTDTNSQIYGNVADGSDATGAAPDVMCFLYGAPGIIYGNYVGHMSNGYINGNTGGGGNWVRLFYNNLIEYIYQSVDSATHENMFESIGDGGTIAFNNVIRHGQFTGLVVFELAPFAGDTSYAFDNVLYDIDSSNGQQCYEGATSPGTCYFFNNTSQCGPIGSSNITCGRATGSGQGHFINEHTITSASPAFSGSSVTTVTNVNQTESAATAQGYTATETYPYSPTADTNATVGTGVNELLLCTAITATNTVAGTACLDDSEAGLIYDTANHTVSWPNRPALAQLSTGAWDVGAYRFGFGSVSGQPVPPLGLTAAVQ